MQLVSDSEWRQIVELTLALSDRWLRQVQVPKAAEKKQNKFDRNKFEIQRFVSGYDETTEA